ncbi:GSCOCG00002279001-RA-CDS [Cotesia congregata]|uniref:DNA-directed RNA polymerase III subunit RPC3 n=1 Tax=Cotesia congregata TaxID=51543 RepID=A0A8J2MQW9_COTCN|nr:GSCOCG00002279001-RA-CDS [Cotesia congregata]CAG5103801.1 Similar to Polr3c: DNA-directed RNA polymerase III subunit RPC3 (Mus musculus) [Cotesia congregata]
MSYMCGKLCSAILLQHFGETVESVGDCLFKNNKQTVPFIISKLRLPPNKVRESLCVLIRFGLVSYEQEEKEPIRYVLDYDKVLNILRYSRFMLFIKKCSGDESEIMFEEVLKNGYETASQVIIRAYEKISKVNKIPSVELLYEQFQTMVKNQFLIRNTPENNKNDKTSSIGNTDFDVPKLNLEEIQKIVDKAINSEGKTGFSDDNIYWKVNFDRLIQDLRDEIIVETVGRIYDNDAAELMRRLIFLMYTRTASWAPTSNPIPFHEIREDIRKLNIPKLTQYLDQYLQIIVEDSRRFVKRVGDSGGGQFSIDVKEIMSQLAWATVENVVLERFGSKAARIFRLVRHEKFIEEDKIKQIAMMPEREIKELMYILLDKNYLQVQEVKKSTAPTAPMKGIFLLHINFNHVVRMVVEHCYHALYNTILRRNHVTTTNDSLMDKHLRLETVLSNLEAMNADPAQIDQVRLLLTPAEKIQVDKVKTTTKTLGTAELFIEDTLFLLKMYLRYH